jgi:hypothetical protein
MSISIAKFVRAIRTLPSDQPCITSGKWYKTQKEHWIGWLSEYHGPGAYGRSTGHARDAKFAYNHIVEYRMLLWLIKAADIDPKLVTKAKKAAAKHAALQQQAAAVRKHVPWSKIELAIWGNRGAA